MTYQPDAHDEEWEDTQQFKTGIDADTISEYTGGNGVDVEGVKLRDSYAQFAEIASPALPPANSGELYAKDVAGETHIMFQDSAGTEFDLTQSTLSGVILRESDGSPAIADVDTINLDQAQGLNVTDDGSNDATISIDDATTTGKGVSQYTAADFDVAAGVVSLEDSVVKSVTTDAGTSTPVGHDFDILGGEGIDTSASGDAITIAAELASSSNKGVASFDAANFDSPAGAVSIKTDGVGSDEIDRATGYTWTGAHDFTGGSITVPLATTGSDAVSKDYIDGLSIGTDWKDSVRAASTGNVVIASELENGDALDGVTLATGDRVLLKDQTDASENGLYEVVASGAASRTSDANQDAEVTSGLTCFVEEGTVNFGSTYRITTADDITVDTTDITFTQISGAGQITAGLGLTKTGNTLDIGEGDGITIFANSIAVDDGPGLTIESGALAVNDDDSTLEIVSDVLRVKDDGITGAKLHPDVAGDGLSQDGSGNLDINVDDSTIELNADALRLKDDGVTGTKLAPAVAGSGLVQDGSGNLDVNVKEGIEIDSDALRIDEDFAATWTVDQTFSGGVSTDTIAEENAGAGVTVDGALIKDSNVRLPLTTKSTGFTASATEQVLLVSASGGAVTAQLPTASGITGKLYVIKKTDSSANAVTIDPNGSETVDGASTFVIENQYESVHVISDGTNWHII